MREIQFYRNASGDCPVEEFLDELGSKQAQKIAWVLQLVRELPLAGTMQLRFAIPHAKAAKIAKEFVFDLRSAFTEE